jgi:DnaK suppressor protein
MAAKKKPKAKKRPTVKKSKPAKKKAAVKRPAPKKAPKAVKKPAPVKAKAKVIAAPPKKSATPMLKVVSTAQPSKISSKVKAPAPIPKVFSARPLSPIKPPDTTKGPKIPVVPYRRSAGEDYMNTKQVAHFRQLLLNWRRDLMEEVDRTVAHMQDDAANFPDPNDRATQEEEFALELRTRDRERKLIKKINDSLAALDAGVYGYCEECGIEIGVQRLEARPTATLCVDCKTLDEIREKQRA